VADLQTQMTSHLTFKPVYRPWNPWEVESLKELHGTGRSLAEVSAQLGRSYDSVSIKAGKLGLRFLRPDRRKVDEAVFDKPGQAEAWLLGLLWADGTWGGARHSIGLSSTDRDLLEKTVQILSSDYPIRSHNPRSVRGTKGTKMQYRLYVNSKVLCNRLTELAGGRLKTERIRIPSLSPELIPHFIRGYWDGDGGVSVKSPQAYLCGNHGLVAEIVAHLAEAGVTIPRVSNATNCAGIAKVHFSRAADLETLFSYLYQGATYYGERKRQLWDELLEIKRKGRAA
jgi:hypothetical protein